ncbi:MAG TPA: hypothetical protein VK324_06590 [Tepidisphaeraceae bacterium]|nr:hypothetical protein [Tepidisphaeraceae bacterium]
MRSWPEHRKKAAIYFAVAVALVLTAGWAIYDVATDAAAGITPPQGRVKGVVLMTFGLLTAAAWAFNTGAYYWSDWADPDRQRDRDRRR